MSQPTYQKLIAERDWLRNRVRELEEENARLKGKLGNVVSGKRQEPSAHNLHAMRANMPDGFIVTMKGRRKC